MEKPKIIPQNMIDTSADPSWFVFAIFISGFCRFVGWTVVSYACENSGNLFVHLVPQLGHDEGAAKSLKGLRGHTDGTVFPIGGVTSIDTELPKGPDAVILGCLNNPNKVATTLAPLSSIAKKLSREDIIQLRRNVYIFRPQSSFNLPDVVRTHQPILCSSDHDGLLIRYSHSKVEPMTSESGPKDALSNLGKAIAISLQKVVLAPGDIAFVNNRTAIHGRTEVALHDAENRRWILRTYGQSEVDSGFSTDPTRPFELHRK
jgi:hypothetical protein